VRLVLFNKPYRVLTRFTSPDGRATLADYLRLPGLYPAGRLDYDSEGLLLLSDEGRLRAAITDPRHALAKTYWVQVEGEPEAAALARLERGVLLSDGWTRPAAVRRIDPPPGLWPREPPIRLRLRIPTAWLELSISEGRNRQVRRMSAAVGLPVLRLVRARIGPWTLAGLAPGACREAQAAEALAFSHALATQPVRARGARSASRPRAPARSSAAGRPSSGRHARGPRR
jgi:23S rRNA pseudouridine2457 synthase